MNLFRMIIRRFDDWLSRVEGVKPFTYEPLIMLRLQNARARWNIPLPDHLILAGSPVVLLHLWNERIPLIALQGPSLDWALQFQRRLLYSLGAVALHLQGTASMKDVQAVGGVIAQIHLENPDGGRFLLEDLGFRLFPYHRPAGAFGEFWENLYTWLLMWAFNPASLRSHALLGLQRNEFWMTKESFLERFGKV